MLSQITKHMLIKWVLIKIFKPSKNNYYYVHFTDVGEHWVDQNQKSEVLWNTPKITLDES